MPPVRKEDYSHEEGRWTGPLDCSALCVQVVMRARYLFGFVHLKTVLYGNVAGRKDFSIRRARQWIGTSIECR